MPGLRLQHIIWGLLAGLVPIPSVVAAWGDDAWIEIDAMGDSAGPAAEVLAKKLGDKLSAERSKVIFLDIGKCEPGLADGTTWCSMLKSSLASSLIKRGFRFLPEEATKEIREKIAQEQIYQHNSMQVDVGKTVELGKQKAFQAFTSVAAAGDGHGNVRLSASSVSIKEGVVTISENVGVKIKREEIRPWGVWFKGWLFMGGGIVGTAGGLYEAKKAKAKADDHYAEYKKAGNADNATAARRKVETQDKVVSLYQGATAAGAIIGLYGWYYYMANKEEVLSYQVGVLGIGNRHEGENQEDRVGGWNISPLVTNRLVGMVLSTDW